MSYYNNIMVVFNNFGELDCRSAGQILPKGSIPVAIVNYHNGTITEIINDVPKEEMVNYANNFLASVLHQIHQPENNTHYIAPEEWKYIES